MMKTDDFIEQLGRHATPAAPLPAPARRTAVWLFWSVAYLVVVTMVMVAGPATVSAVTPLYLLQQGAAGVTAILAARAAFGSVIPGAAARLWAPPIVGAGVWLALMLWHAMLDVRTGTFGLGSQTDWPCVASLAMGGLVLGGSLVWMLRRGAPLTPGSTAFLAGLAALSIANIQACLTRPHALASTILVWHGATIVVVCCVFAVLGRRWLRWPSSLLR